MIDKRLQLVALGMELRAERVFNTQDPWLAQSSALHKVQNFQTTVRLDFHSSEVTVLGLCPLPFGLV